MTISCLRQGRNDLYLLGAPQADAFPANALLLLRKDGRNVAAFRIESASPLPRNFRARVIRKYEAISELHTGSDYEGVVYLSRGSTSNSDRSERSSDHSRSSGTSPSYRMSHRFGVEGSIGGSEPFLGFYGANVSYNITDYARVTLGYGFTPLLTDTATTFGGGVKFFVPGWNLSPTIGIEYYVMSVDYSGLATSLVNILGGDPTNTTMQSASALSFPIGVDWQTKVGFHAALLTSLAIGSGGAGVATIAAEAGWYFNLGGNSRR